MIKKLFLFLAFFSGIAFGDYGYVGGVWYSPTLGAVSSSATAKGATAPGTVILPPITTPPAPSSPLNICYTKSDGGYYCENPSGVEVKIGPGGTSTVTRNLYVDGGRTDSYTATGSISYPFKTIAAAVSQVVTNADNSTNAYNIIIAPFSYTETITLNNAALFNLTFSSLTAPATAVQNVIVQGISSTSANTQLQTLVFTGITVNGPVNLTGNITGTNFCGVQCLFSDLQFNNSGSTVTLNNVNNVNFYNVQIQGGSSVSTFTNVAFGYIANVEGYGSSGTTLHLVDNPGGNIPAQYSGNYLLLSSTKYYGTMTIDAGSEMDSLLSYFGSNSNVTNNGTIHSWGTNWGDTSPIVLNNGSVTRLEGDVFRAYPTVNAGATLTNIGIYPYTPATPGNWTIVPTKVYQALDQLASQKQNTGNYITALTGDVTAAGPGSSAATLATVNSNVGSFTNANITVNAKGLITAAANGSAGISGSGTSGQVTVWNGSSSLTGYTGFTSDSSGNVTTNSLISQLHRGADVSSGASTVPATTVVRGGNQTVNSATANGGDLTLAGGSTTGTSSTGNPGSVNIQTGTDVSNAKVSKINFQIADFSTVGSGTLLAPIYFAPNGPGTGADLVLHSGTTLWFNTGSQSGSNYLQGNSGNTVMTLSGTNILNLNATSASSIIQISATNGGGSGHIYLGNASNVIGGGSSSRGQVGFANADLTVTADNSFDAGYDGHNAARFRNIYAGTAFGLGPPSAPNILIENPETQSITINTNPSTSITDSTIIGWHAGNASMSGAEQLLLGAEVGHNMTSATENVAGGDEVLFNLTTGVYNTVFGSAAMRSSVSGSHNAVYGDQALRFGMTASNNTCAGEDCLNIETGNNSVALGFFAGAYSVVGNEFYLNNVDQVNTAQDKTFSLLYGQFSGTAASLTGQQLTVNGTLNVNGNIGSSGGSINPTHIFPGTDVQFPSGSTGTLPIRSTAVSSTGIYFPANQVMFTSQGEDIAFIQNPSHQGQLTGAFNSASFIGFNGNGAGRMQIGAHTLGSLLTDGTNALFWFADDGFGQPGIGLPLGAGLYVGQGTNGMAGHVTLSGGTATVSIAHITSAFECFATVKTLGTVVTPQAIQCSTGSGSITITSAGVTDTSVVSYIVVGPT